MRTLSIDVSTAEDPARARWVRGAVVGGAVGLVVQIWMLTSGTWNLFRWGRQSDFYDVQARALLDGTFAMDQRVLGIESFARGDQHFMYFGPIPAVLRIPVVAFTRSLDGRLAAASMLLALVATLAAFIALGWRLRCRAVESAAVTTFESVTVGLASFSLVGGSSLLYAASRTWVYHEAILWGVALTLASLAALLAWIDASELDDPNANRLLVWASAWATLALLTRPSVGGGALAALGLVAARAAVEPLLARRRGTAPAEPSDEVGRSAPSIALAAAVVLPVVAYSIVNWLKFRRLLGVPFDQQGFTLLSEQRRQMLEANGGTLFNPEFVPTNLVSYLRPDLVGVDGSFPFVQPRRPVTTIGSPFYDLIDLTSGIPTTMPLFLVLGSIGAWATLRRGSGRLRAVRPLLGGCALGSVAVLAIGYLANRYQSDFLPLLVVSALVGLPIVVRWCESDATSARSRQVTALLVAAAVVGIGWVSNAALGYSYQRAYGPSTHPDVVADYIDTQRRVAGWFGDGRLTQVRQVDELATSSDIGDIAVFGDCDALYLSDGGVPSDGRLTQWRLAELSSDFGRASGSVTFDPSRSASTQLLSVVVDGETVDVRIERDAARGVMTAVARRGGVDARGPDLPLRVGTPLPWQLFADPVLGRFELFLDDRFAAFTDLPIGSPAADVVVTIDDAGVTSSTAATPVCDRLLADLENAASTRLPR